MPRERLPARRHSETTDLSYCGRRYHLTVGRYLDGRIGEVFICGAKSGSDVDGLCADVGVLVSRLLQYGDTPALLALGMGRLGDGTTPASLVGAVADTLLGGATQENKKGKTL